MSQATRAARLRRHRRVRKRVVGTPERPRLSVFRSLHHVYAQVIDDSRGHTLVAASTVEADLRPESGNKSEQARAIGAALAQRAKEAGITKVVFDRGGYQYHGRVEQLAEGARQAGLEF